MLRKRDGVFVNVAALEASRLNFSSADASSTDASSTDANHDTNYFGVVEDYGSSVPSSGAAMADISVSAAPVVFGLKWVRALFSKTSKAPLYWPRFPGQPRSRVETPSTLDSLITALDRGLFSRVCVLLGAGTKSQLMPTSAQIEAALGPTSVGLGAVSEAFDVDRFLHDPSLFYAVAGSMVPTRKQRQMFQSMDMLAVHRLVHQLAARQLLQRCYTLSVDGLDRRALCVQKQGTVLVEPDKLVECFGSFDDPALCSNCHSPVSVGEYNDFLVRRWKELTDSADSSVSPDYQSFSVHGGVPFCRTCEGERLKPALVLEGEPLSGHFFDCLAKDIVHCDLLIVLGASFILQPVSQLFYRCLGPRVVFDVAAAPRFSQDPQEFLVSPRAPFDGSKPAGRDCWVPGDANVNVGRLLLKLGWV